MSKNRIAMKPTRMVPGKSIEDDSINPPDSILAKRRINILLLFSVSFGVHGCYIFLPTCDAPPLPVSVGISSSHGVAHRVPTLTQHIAHRLNPD